MRAPPVHEVPPRHGPFRLNRHVPHRTPAGPDAAAANRPATPAGPRAGADAGCKPAHAVSRHRSAARPGGRYPRRGRRGLCAEKGRPHPAPTDVRRRRDRGAGARTALGGAAAGPGTGRQCPLGTGQGGGRPAGTAGANDGRSGTVSGPWPRVRRALCLCP